jgi:hypothetical protein
MTLAVPFFGNFRIITLSLLNIGIPLYANAKELKLLG